MDIRSDTKCLVPVCFVQGFHWSWEGKHNCFQSLRILSFALFPQLLLFFYYYLGSLPLSYIASVIPKMEEPNPDFISSSSTDHGCSCGEVEPQHPLHHQHLDEEEQFFSKNNGKNEEESVSPLSSPLSAKRRDAHKRKNSKSQKGSLSKKNHTVTRVLKTTNITSTSAFSMLRDSHHSGLYVEEGQSKEELGTFQSEDTEVTEEEEEEEEEGNTPTFCFEVEANGKYHHLVPNREEEQSVCNSDCTPVGSPCFEKKEDFERREDYINAEGLATATDKSSSSDDSFWDIAESSESSKSVSSTEER